MFTKLVVEHFEKAVLKLEPPKISVELKRQLLRDRDKHPRLGVFLSNMSKELVNMQTQRRKEGKKPATLAQVIWLIEEMTTVFVVSIEAEAKRRMESDLARLQREQEAQAQKDLDLTLEGKPQGIYEEMGLIANEEKIGSRDQGLEI